MSSDESRNSGAGIEQIRDIAQNAAEECAQARRAFYAATDRLLDEHPDAYRKIESLWLGIRSVESLRDTFPNDTNLLLQLEATWGEKLRGARKAEAVLERAVKKELRVVDRAIRRMGAAAFVSEPLT